MSLVILMNDQRLEAEAAELQRRIARLYGAVSPAGTRLYNELESRLRLVRHVQAQRKASAAKEATQ